MFLRLPENKIGRDFVVGDLHGCRFFLECLLEHVTFDPTVDRLFSVGDLADRGPDSMGCLKLLNEPWFHAVRGNHEVMLLDFVGSSPRDGDPPSIDESHMLLDNGGDWVLSQYDHQRDVWPEEFAALYEKVKRLPFVLIVGEGTNRFNLVHADLYDSDCNDQVLHDSDLDRLAEQWSDFDWDTPPDRYPYFAQHFLWSRVVAGLPEGNATPSFLPGLSPTFCGHTIVFSVRPVRSHIFIDTGAFLASDAMNATGIFGLTLADVMHRKLHFMAFPDQPKRIMTCELRLPARFGH